VLVITRTHASGLEIAPRIEAAGLVPLLLPATQLWRAEDLAAAPAAILVLREVPTEQKVTVCGSLRASPRYGALPLVVVTNLTEGSLSLPADVVIRPPAPLAEALAEIKRRISGAG